VARDYRGRCGVPSTEYFTAILTSSTILYGLWRRLARVAQTLRSPRKAGARAVVPCEWVSLRLTNWEEVRLRHRTPGKLLPSTVKVLLNHLDTSNELTGNMPCRCAKYERLQMDRLDLCEITILPAYVKFTNFTGSEANHRVHGACKASFHEPRFICSSHPAAMDSFTSTTIWRCLLVTEARILPIFLHGISEDKRNRCKEGCN
jgi:hypothetical protein